MFSFEGGISFCEFGDVGTRVCRNRRQRRYSQVHDLQYENYTDANALIVHLMNDFVELVTFAFPKSSANVQVRLQYIPNR